MNGKDLCAGKQVKIEICLERCCQIENSNSILQGLIFSYIFVNNESKHVASQEIKTVKHPNDQIFFCIFLSTHRSGK